MRQATSKVFKLKSVLPKPTHFRSRHPQVSTVSPGSVVGPVGLKPVMLGRLPIRGDIHAWHSRFFACKPKDFCQKLNGNNVNMGVSRLGFEIDFRVRYRL